MKTLAEMSKSEQRAQIARDVEAFYNRGNEAEIVAPDMTTKQKRKRHGRRYKVRWQPIERTSTETAYIYAIDAQTAVENAIDKGAVPVEAIIIDAIPA